MQPTAESLSEGVLWGGSEASLAEARPPGKCHVETEDNSKWGRGPALGLG